MFKISAIICVAAAFLFHIPSAFSQEILVSGRVIDGGTRQALSGATISIDTLSFKTQTDENGQFHFSTSLPAPFTLVIAHAGYDSVKKQIRGKVRKLIIELDPQNILGQEVVVSASRIPERILESPVAVERLGVENLRRSPEPSFYDAVAKLKGVEVSTQSLTFRSFNTRGFNANGNTRFNQLIDGMDNQAPGLSFPIGNIAGLTDLDIDNIELLPGVSSALYGAGGTNGTLLMTSKSPFTYPGLTVQFGLGMNQNNSAWPQLSFRYAKVVNKRLGVKISGSYFNAQDWEAHDYSNFDRINRVSKSGSRNSDPMYDGVNVYGDEPNLKYPTLKQIGALAKAAAAEDPSLADDYAAVITAYDNNLLPNEAVTRTGYAEKDLVNYDAKSFKTSGAIYYKLSNSVQAIAEANWGLGTSVYTGSDRYSLQNFNISQYKLELKGDNFFIRGYTTQERSGDAYNATLLASLINEAWKPSETWLQEYTGAFAAARLSGQSEKQAYLSGRSFADRDRPDPGSQEFNSLKDEISSTDIGADNGARFNDRSNLYHYEGMYNFSNLLNSNLELIGGASYRVYVLNSGGTIFDDLERNIRIHEYGAYAQAGKRLSDGFKLTASVRYDKNENFNGRLTPRIAGLWTVAPNQNIHVSYQTGFRNPTAQNQYIDLAVAGNSIRLIGGLPEILKKYNLYNNKAYTGESYREFLATGDYDNLELYNFNTEGIRPEQIRTFELGYRGLYKNHLLIDGYAYYNRYRNYITAVEIYQNPTPGSPSGLQNVTRFDVPVNNPGRVTSWGMALGADYKWKKYGFNGNIAYNKLGNIPAGYFNDFNTPEVRLNVGVSSSEIFKNVGLYLSYTWQSSFLWQSPFVSGDVPAYGTVDGQINFKLPVYNSVLKIGGTNLFNRYYRTSYGNPSVGGVYYISLLFDQFLK